MSKFCRFLILTASVAVLLVVGIVTVDAQTVDEILSKVTKMPEQEFWAPIYLKLELVEIPEKAGAVRFKGFVSPKGACSELTLRIEEDRIQVTSEHVWTVSASPSDTVEFFIDAVIPPNDTSGFFIWAEGCGARHLVKAFFVAYDDTIRYYYGNPKWYTAQTNRVPPRTSHGLWGDAYRKEQERIANLPHKYRITREGADGIWYNIDSLPEDFVPKYQPPHPWKYGDSLRFQDETGWHVMTRDSALAYREARHEATLAKLASDKLAGEIARKDSLEQFPLVGRDKEYIRVGNDAYRRDEGETKFRLMEKRRDNESHYDRIRRNAKKRPGGLTEIVIDLRDPDHYALAKDSADFLEPADSAGFYKTNSSWWLRTVLHDHNIKYKVIPRKESGVQKGTEEKGSLSGPLSPHRTLNLAYWQLF